jgi:hypothetical protein
MSVPVTSNVKAITSGQVPTIDNLPEGYFAFGTIDGANRLFGNPTGNKIEEYVIFRRDVSERTENGKTCLTKNAGKSLNYGKQA